MTAQILDGKVASEAIRQEVAAQVAALVAGGGSAPGLATVLAGDDPASVWYVGSIGRQARRVGMSWQDVRVDPAQGDAGLRRTIEALNADSAVSGVIVMLPLPAPLTLGSVAEVLSPEKDVDGITVQNAGRLTLGMPALVPCTPAGGVELLKRNGIALQGKEVVVVGRSNIVGKPLAQLLLAEHATVTICHSRTQDLTAVCRRADVVCAAVGQPRLITAEHVKPSAVVLDFGTNPTADGKLVGDVDYGPVSEMAGWISPVPGGTEVMTTAILLRQTLLAATARSAGASS